MEAIDWKSTYVYMIDFEGSRSSGVVEFGIVTLHDGKIQEVETKLCRPTGPINARDREVHGIDAGEASHHQPFSAHYERFVALRRKGIFAAHNRHAENAFIKSTWALPPKVPDWRSGLGMAQEWGPWIDTLSLCKALYPGQSSYALGDLVDRFGLRPKLEAIARERCPAARQRPHCALYDALASALLLLQMESSAELKDRITPGWLLQLSRGVETQQELF